jgi:hypothetical protein
MPSWANGFPHFGGAAGCPRSAVPRRLCRVRQRRPIALPTVSRRTGARGHPENPSGWLNRVYRPALRRRSSSHFAGAQRKWSHRRREAAQRGVRGSTAPRFATRSRVPRGANEQGGVAPPGLRPGCTALQTGGFRAGKSPATSTHNPEPEELGLRRSSSQPARVDAVAHIPSRAAIHPYRRRRHDRRNSRRGRAGGSGRRRRGRWSRRSRLHTETLREFPAHPVTFTSHGSTVGLKARDEPPDIQASRA